LESFVADGLDAFGAVVVDLPALLPAEQFVVPWPPVLDQLFVVLRDAATPLALVRQALEKLGSHVATQLVLNRASAPEARIRPPASTSCSVARSCSNSSRSPALPRRRHRVTSSRTSPSTPRSR